MPDTPSFIQPSPPSWLAQFLQSLRELGIPVPGQDLRLLDPVRVVVRFKREIRLPVGPKPAELERLQGWREATRDLAKPLVRRLFTDEALGCLRLLSERAKRNHPEFQPTDFESFYYVVARPRAPGGGVDHRALAQSLLQAKEIIANAYVDRPAPNGSPATPLIGHVDEQYYREPAPDGIDADYANTVLGGDGQDESFIDVERGWTLDHRDLAPLGIPCNGTISDASRWHGTPVLGVIGGQNEGGLGCLGIVPNASVGVFAVSTASSRPNVIACAAEELAQQDGGTLLIEVQVLLDVPASGQQDPPRLCGPVEALEADFQVIRTATAAGVSVVEVGGNGGRGGVPESNTAIDFNTYVDALSHPVLNRNFRDSGAILVSAAFAPAVAGGTGPARQRMPYAPYGNRIDCFAWGERIVSCSSEPGGDKTMYTLDFGGTSGASAIIAGAAVALRGALSKSGKPIDPATLRARLSDPGGTPSFWTPPPGSLPGTPNPEPIGVMPDLRKLV
ncbi:MAG: hypothetical protein RL033_3291 [Pseudomonadota bacterium]